MVVPELRWAALTGVLFAVGGVLYLSPVDDLLWWMAFALCYAAGGWRPGLDGLRALGEGSLDVDLLMVVAAVAAAAIGQVLDGALLIVIFATSGALEALATARTRASVTALLDLTPETATLLDDADTETVVPAAGLEIGDVIRVRPGERVGADGEVLDGASEVDQASVTGESMPVPKSVGGEVYAGTMNGTGALTVRVTRRAGDSVVGRIAALVDEATRTKASTQLFIERVEQRYSVAMVAATLALFVVPLAVGAALEPTLLRAITFMVVASPCAVVLATMPPLLSAIANAGRHGVLVKSAVAMETLGRTDAVAFDKTGTLTEGTPSVTAVDLLTGTGLTATELVELAAGAEWPSEHPLAAAIVRAARRVPDAAEFGSQPGRGVRAVVRGRHVAVSSPTRDVDAVAGLVADRERVGDTVVVVSVDGDPCGVIALADRVRPDATDAVGALGRLGVADVVLLTGDNERAARRLATEVGIADVRAGLLPEGKVDSVDALRGQGRTVLVVGDGVNDAPAMAAAHVGLAVGGRATDLALQTSDVVVVHDELTAVPAVVALSRHSRRVVVANLVIAAVVIVGLVAWDLLGTLPLPLGVAGHEGSTVLVGLNGLRLLRRSAWTGSARERAAHE